VHGTPPGTGFSFPQPHIPRPVPFFHRISTQPEIPLPVEGRPLLPAQKTMEALHVREPVNHRPALGALVSEGARLLPRHQKHALPLDKHPLHLKGARRFAFQGMLRQRMPANPRNAVDHAFHFFQIVLDQGMGDVRRRLKQIVSQLPQKFFPVHGPIPQRSICPTTASINAGTACLTSSDNPIPKAKEAGSIPNSITSLGPFPRHCAACSTSWNPI